MNFQTVSVAEKVDSPGTLTKNPDGTYTVGPQELAGYVPGTTTPRPLLSSAFDYVNAQLQRMVDTIQRDGLASSTAIIITAKHGQSPQDPLLLKRIKDGPIIDAINAAWTAQTGDRNNLIVAGTDDDLWQSYLSVKTQAAADFVKSYLWNHSATAVLYSNDGVNRGTEQVAHSGLAQIHAGDEAAKFFGVPYNDPRYPDVLGRVQVGVVYTGGTKIAEHGGDNPGDRDVPLLVYAPGDGSALEGPRLGRDDPGGTDDAPPAPSESERAEGGPGGGHEGPPRHRLTNAAPPTTRTGVPGLRRTGQFACAHPPTGCRPSRRGESSAPGRGPKRAHSRETHPPPTHSAPTPRARSRSRPVARRQPRCGRAECSFARAHVPPR